ncbi:helix-turn-helix transcriptional regulator [Oceanobacter mangrovi]|uniref:helix-turn-helix transcriptional regulator n=1 Tax=Oceanobacter mangrovi TaxID=2862510 RepID=UPI001C8D9881|nr:hypothetical protein [Oceanobacter mangrovi]
MTTPQSPILAAAKLNQTEAAKAAGCSVSHWKREVEANRAPQPLYIAGKKVWLESDIEAWIIQQNPQLLAAIELKQQAAALMAKSKFRRKSKPASKLGVAA